MIDKAILALPGIKKILLFLLGLGVVQACLVLGQAVALSRTVTALWYGEALLDQAIWVAAFLLCFICQQVMRYLQDALLESYAAKQANSLREQLLDKVFLAGKTLSQTSGTGTTTATVIEGTDQVANYIRLMLPKITEIATIPPLLLVVAFALDWVSGLIMLVTFPFIVLYMAILGGSARERAARQYGDYQKLSNHFVDSLRGLETLKLFGISKEHGQSIFAVSERFRNATIRTLRVATLSSLVLDLFATLSLAGVAIMLGMRLLDGTLMLFPALALLILVPQFYKPVREFAADYHASLDGKNALKAINALLSYNTVAPEQKALPSWQANTELRALDLNYSYPDHQALTQVSFEARGFAKVGIIGLSGSGKSTLIEMLGGFLNPDSGSLCVDQQELPGLKQHNWQKQLIYIPQDPYIFQASLRENITFYTPDASEESIKRVVDTVGLTSLIGSLPKGLDTLIGEGERALSGGQAQRIALARAFLDSSRRILLFDEPTAHLDIETERELKERMLPLFENRLVFFATHRLHWLDEMDTVIVLDKGRIIAQGATQEIQREFGSLANFFARVGGNGS